MKTIKTTILGLALVLSASAFGQETKQPVSMKNMIKVGANVGYSLPTENAGFIAGLDVAYQHLLTPSFGIGLASGYSHFFGNDDKFNNNDFGVIPAAALLRYYPKNTGFYAGANVGYGFITGDDQVANGVSVQRPDGGFYLKPELGYHNRDWNFSLHYQKTFTGSNGEIASQKYNAGSLGLGVAYNIPLGE